MKKIILSLFAFSCVCGVAEAAFTSCGPGYILVDRANIDGVPAKECQKLWCVDLETGKPMGKGKNPASGYRATNVPTELCDANDNCVECFGERKWCGGETPGQWEPELGIYSRGGADSAYTAYQKGSCFAWRLEKPECPNGETAVLRDGRWRCATASTGGTNVTLKSSVRRTGTMRRGAR